jgi:hypothetical protein
MLFPPFRLARRITSLALLLTAGGGFAAESAYLYTSFRESGDGLHLASSVDGLIWNDLGRVFLRPTVGEKLFRDPHLFRDPTGLYHLVWTSGWRDLGIGYATSPDLVHWSPQRHLPLAARIPGAKNAWTPEIVHDPAKNRFVITWVSDVPGWFGEEGGRPRASNRTYCVTTRDFVEFSEPALLIEPGFDHVDTTLLSWQGRYIALFRQGDDGKRWGPHHAAVADSPTGPYRLLPGTVPPQTRAEGATVLAQKDRCLLYVPIPAERRFAVYATRDWQNWEDLSGQAAMAPGQGQGNIVTVPAQTLGVLDGTAPVAPSAFSSETVPAPILPGLNADPALRRFGNTYYLYPTTDRPRWSSNSFSVWTSPDLKTWSPAGVALDLPSSLSWARAQAWTPDCVERDGTYYFYFCAETKIGVAKANRPEGPFRDALGGPLLEHGGAVRAKTIAPHVFIDDDGKAYLYYGSGQNLAQVVRLGTDMVSLLGAPEDLAIGDFLEGLVVFKRRGVYYFMWTSQPRGQPSKVCYGTADSPLGPIRRPAGADVVLRSDAPLVGAGYHSVLNIPGTDRWYVAYHRQAIPGGGLDRREICLARMEFTADGAILPIDPLAPVFGPSSVGETLNGGLGRP